MDLKNHENIVKETNKPTEEDKEIRFTHKELVNLTRDAINKIIESDPIFRGLAQDPTVEEVKSQTAVAQGQAITLYLNRGELSTLPIVVPTHNTTVLDLKKAVKLHTSLSLKRNNTTKKISWEHVWKRYDLTFDDIKLTNDNLNIKEYGITNKADIYYTKRFREKNRIKQR